MALSQQDFNQELLHIVQRVIKELRSAFINNPEAQKILISTQQRIQTLEEELPV